MGVAENPPAGNDGIGQADTGVSLGGTDGCRLFDWLWERLSATLGTPATAALMRRAVSIAAQSYPNLRDIAISRERLSYSYKIPEPLCTDELENPVAVYQTLAKEVLRLTGELTGGVMVRGLVKSEELSPWLPDTQEVEKWLNPAG